MTWVEVVKEDLKELAICKVDVLDRTRWKKAGSLLCWHSYLYLICQLNSASLQQGSDYNEGDTLHDNYTVCWEVHYVTPTQYLSLTSCCLCARHGVILFLVSRLLARVFTVVRLFQRAAVQKIQDLNQKSIKQLFVHALSKMLRSKIHPFLMIVQGALPCGM